MASRRCPSCTEPGTLMCAGCKIAKYCSTYCQQADWPYHKVLCKSLKEFQTRPAPEMRRVVYFPPDKPKPEFRWLPVKKYFGELSIPNEIAQTVDADELMEGHIAKPRYITCNDIVGTKTDLTIEFVFDDDFMVNYDKTNKAALTATNRQMCFGWRGPLVACCGHVTTQPLSLDLVKIEDMDMNTYSDLIAYLIDFNNKFPTNMLRKGPKVPAVKLHCDGEREEKGLPFAQAVSIPRTHPVFTKTAFSMISKKVGLQLRVWKEDNRKKDSNPPAGYYCNEQVTFMMRACDPTTKDTFSNTFGFPADHWMGGEVTNVIIARLDRNPLDLQSVEAFGDFCAHHLSPYFQWSAEIVGDYPDRELECKNIVVEQMTPENWSLYYSKWQNKKAGLRTDVEEEETGMGLSAMSEDKLAQHISKTNFANFKVTGSFKGK